MAIGGGDPNKKKPLTVRDIFIDGLSGGIGGAIEICITFPFEFAKTQQQLDPQKWKGKSFVDCWKDTYRTFGGFPKGFFALYRGLPPLVIFNVPRVSSRFAAAEFTNQKLREYYPHMGLISRNIIAGFAGGLSEAVLVTTYQETMKVRLIHDRLSPNPRFKGTVHGITTIIKEQAFLGIYKGLFPTILKQGSNQAIRFPVYYYLKNMMCANPNQGFSQNGYILGNVQGLLVGAAAGAASVFGNTPIDVIKTKMQGFEAHKYRNIFHCISCIWAEDGFRGFYKGMGARMGRVSCDVAITFLVVDEIKGFVKKFLD